METFNKLSKDTFAESPPQIMSPIKSNIKKYHFSIVDDQMSEIVEEIEPPLNSLSKKSRVFTSRNELPQEQKLQKKKSRLRSIGRSKKIPKHIQDRLNNQRTLFRQKAGRFRMSTENKKLFFGLEDEEIEQQPPKKLVIIQHPYDGNLIKTIDEVNEMGI